MECVLQTEALTVGINSKKILVDNVSFSLYKNETLALVGESGCGKTTTAHTLLGLNRYKKNFFAEGSVLFEDKNLITLREKPFRALRGSKISIVFQDPQTALNPVFSIGSQLAEVFEIHGSDDSENEVFNALQQVGLATITRPFDVYPHELSGGMKQRVMIAMALAMRPKVLIADEPTSALDIRVQKEILDLLKTYQKNHDMATLFITHDFSVVEEVADRVIVMYKGQIVEEGAKKEIFENPLHPYTQALLQARLTKEKRKKMLDVGFVNGKMNNTGQGPGQGPGQGCAYFLRCPKAKPACKNSAIDFVQESPTHKVRCFLYGEKE